MLFKLAFQNIRRSKGYFLSYIITISTFLVIVYGISIMQDALINGVFSSLQLKSLSLSSLFLALKIIIYGIIVLFTIYTSRFFIRRRSKEVALLKTLGLNRRKIWTVLVIENTVVLTISMIIGMLIGILFSRFILILGSAMFGFTLSQVGFVVSSKGLLDLFIVVMLIYLTINLMPIRSIVKVSIVSLFQDNKRQDTLVKKPYFSMIAFFVFFIVLVILLLSKMSSLNSLNISIIGILFFTAILTVIFFYRGFLMYFFNQYKLKNKGIGVPSKQLSYNHLAGSIQSVYKMMTLITVLTAILSVFIVSIFGILNSAVGDLNSQSTHFSAIYQDSSLKKDIHQQIQAIDDSPLSTIPLYFDQESIFVKQSDFLLLLNDLYPKDPFITTVKDLTPNQAIALTYRFSEEDFNLVFPGKELIHLDDNKLYQVFGDIAGTTFENPVNYEFSKTLISLAEDGLFVVLLDSDTVFENPTLSQAYFTTSTTPITKSTLIDYFALASSPLFNGSNQTSFSPNSTLIMILSITATIGLFQIMLFIFMLVVVIALMMSMFFRSLENLEQGANDYAIAERLGMTRKTIWVGVITETFVTQLLPFYIGFIGSLGMYSFLFKGVASSTISFSKAVLEPSTILIFCFLILLTHLLAVILLFITNNRIAVNKHILQD